MNAIRTAGRWVIVCLAAALALLCMACGDGTPAPAGTPSAVLGNVEGFVFTPSSRQGGLVVGISAGAPAGHNALAGADVTTVGSDVHETTDGTGHFLLRGVRAGLDELVITPPGGAAVNRPLTVLGGATVNAGAPAVARDTAADAVRQAVAATTLPGGAPVDLDTMVILGPQHPLPAGVSVQSALDVGIAGAPPPYVVPSPAWFVFVDYLPAARFSHTVGFFFVDAATGDVVAREANGWPAINGLSFYGNDEVNRTSPDLISGAGYAARGAASAAPPAANHRLPLPDQGRDHNNDCGEGKVVGMVVRGDYRQDFALDSINMVRFLRECVGAATVLNYGPPPIDRPAVDGKAEVRSLFGQACSQLGPCDTLYLSIHAHGYESGKQKLIQGSTWDGTQVNENVTEWDLVNDLPWADCPVGHIVIQTDSCFAGQTVANMQQFIEQHPEIFRGKTVTILGSSSAVEISSGALPGDTPGGYFTNAFLEVARQQPCPFIPSAANLASCFDTAAQLTAQRTTEIATVWGPDGKTGQTPTIYHRPLQPGESLDSQGHLVLTAVALDIPANVDSQNLSAGDFPLGWIQNGRAAPTHIPICDHPHLHAASDAGITIVIPAGASFTNADDVVFTFPSGATIGPIPDPDEFGCGYGPTFPKRFD